jgi:hypothetical protein
MNPKEFKLPGLFTEFIKGRRVTLDELSDDIRPSHVTIQSKQTNIVAGLERHSDVALAANEERR